MKNKDLYNRLCVPVLDEIYFLQSEHRALFEDLVNKGRCYLNKDMLGFDTIINALNKENIFMIDELFNEDELFDIHKMLIKASKPSISNQDWIKVSLKE